MKIETVIQGDGVANSGEITVFKQLDPLIDRFAIEKLEIQTIAGETQVWSLPTALAIRNGRTITDTVIKANVGDTGRAILLGGEGQTNFKVEAEFSSVNGVFGGLNAIEIKLINWKDGDTVDLSEIRLADNYVVSGSSLVSANAQSISINETTGTFLTPHPGGIYLYSTAPTDASQTVSYSSTKIVVEDDNDLNVNTVQSTGGFFFGCF